ncbi:AidA/PixA family protein [Agrobacterium vitis]|uniref:AidA/PixA family protein n=1 Tax=Agrobacterium vitis TaxID=373 RepID=UPI001573FF34|nr:AidA/PixA family protein [Agrobacterium vitis]NSZ17926.1 hypothetical protein [Agrobacterium vitis]QZO03592.1 inclusion body family protein [Agrobacterium vitis]UJL88716.1 hypothetical protein AVF2S5_12705 [Agrobacterium vitis]
MSDIIDIEIVIDTANLLAVNSSPSTNPANPTWVGHNYAYMVAPNAYVRSGQASGDLSISADVGDTIRWRMISQSGNTSYSANLTNITYLSGSHIIADPKGQLIQPQTPVPGMTPGTIALPPSGNQAYVSTPQYDFYITTDIVTAGTENYSVLFAVYYYHASALTLKGYFAWDPTITAS